MSFGDEIFGKKGKNRQGPKQKDIEAATAFLTTATGSIFEDIRSIFPQAAETRLQGQQGILDIFRQSIPEVSRLFQAGNIGAQQTQAAGLPQQIAALLGQPLDLSGLQPREITPDLGFIAQAQLPEFQIGLPPPPAPEPAPVPVQPAPRLNTGRGF